MPRLTDEFLITRDPVRWSAPEGFPGSLRQASLFAQDAPSGLEVVLVETRGRPNAAVMRLAWSKRRAGRASPVLLLAFYPTPDGSRISLCGPSGEQPVVRHDLDVSQVERLAAVALAEPNHHAATRFLLAALAELDSPVPGYETSADPCSTTGMGYAGAQVETRLGFGPAHCLTSGPFRRTRW